MRLAFLFPLALLLPAACIPAPQPPAGQRPAPPSRPRAPAPPPRPAPRPAPAPAPQPLPPEKPAPPAPAPFETNRVAPDVRESKAGIYVVKPGDTLRRISDHTGAGSEAIARLNAIPPPFIVRVGQRLRIPAGRWHRVRAGETGIAIARAFGVEWSRIAELNELAEPYILRTGQRLLLPSAREVAGMTLEQRAQAFELDIEDIITGGEPAIAQGEAPEKPSATGRPGKPLSPRVALAPATPFDGSFAWPISGKVVRGYGTYGIGRRNDGIDIGTQLGAPIAAAADGVVVYAGRGIAAYGGLILIRHNESWTTAYGHAGELLVTRGEAVRRGQIIARAGESNLTDRPALHFEIRKGARPVDPTTLLPSRS